MLLKDQIGAQISRKFGLDWYQLVPAFVATYGTEELQDLEGATVFLGAIEEDEDVTLNEADRDYLKALEEWLGMYPEMRTTGE